MAEPAKTPRPQPSAAKTTYLVLYNFISAVAWATVLGRTLVLYGIRGPSFVYLGVGVWTKWTQTMAALEILHSLLGTDNLARSIGVPS
jgi:very-long-chain (3R)-3-hydroxyacyl-CoA dehydratase